MLNTLTRSAFARPLLLLLILVCAEPLSLARPQDVGDALQLIPKPRRVEIKHDRFQLGNKPRLVLAAPKSEDDRFAAEDFANDLQETARLALNIGTSNTRRSILIGSIDLPAIQAAIKRFGASVPANLDPEGYMLLANASEVVVAGATTAGTFYGLQTLKQLVRGDGSTAYIPAVEIVDWPAMRWRGVSDDI
ncbi:MAG TPA: glycoside hydrolase family 20 zincin-like fold domain-containing protein, partial [Pyrinomonadaceae bacterium]